MRAKGLLARVPCNVTLATTVLELDYFFKNCFTSPMTSTKRMSTYWFSKNPAFVGGTPRPCCVAGRTSLLRVPSASSGPHVLHKHTLGRGLAGTRKIAAGHGKLSLIKNIFHLRRAELFAAHKPDYLHPAPPPHTHHRDHERRAHRQRWQCHGWRLRVRAATPACQECWRQRPDLACQVDGEGRRPRYRRRDGPDHRHGCHMPHPRRAGEHGHRAGAIRRSFLVVTM